MSQEGKVLLVGVTVFFLQMTLYLPVKKMLYVRVVSTILGVLLLLNVYPLPLCLKWKYTSRLMYVMYFAVCYIYIIILKYPFTSLFLDFSEEFRGMTKCKCIWSHTYHRVLQHVVPPGPTLSPRHSKVEGNLTYYNM